MRLRVRGVFLLIVIVAFACAVTGTMIWKWKYEDRKAQADWEDMRAMDDVSVALATKVMPLVVKYDQLSKQYPQGSPDTDALARQIASAFPQFKLQSDTPGTNLIPVSRMEYMLHYWSGTK